MNEKMELLEKLLNQNASEKEKVVQAPPKDVLVTFVMEDITAFNYIMSEEVARGIRWFIEEFMKENFDCYIEIHHINEIEKLDFK